MKDLTIRAKIMKFFEEIIWEKLPDLRFGSAILNRTAKAQTTLTTETKLYFINFKNLCTSKDTNNRAQRQPTEWEKVFVNHISGK